MPRATRPVVTLSLSAMALFMSPAHAAGDAGPDILGSFRSQIIGMCATNRISTSSI
jgi:hypothetical protein